MPPKKTNTIMLQCRSKVDKSKIKRTKINDIDHIIISSSTLPDDIVMNGGFYSAEEIAKSFNSLEMTLAPVEHPVDADGNFLSASDPIAINEFHAGAYNKNVRAVGNRILLDKVINIETAKTSDKGRKLLERIEMLEANEDAEPIHTSVGVFLQVEELEKQKIAPNGKEYFWVAKEMVFDHDAILLDSIGAATPADGVGMAINSDGAAITIDRVNLDDLQSTIERALMDVISSPPFSDGWVVDFSDDKVIFMSGGEYFETGYTMDGGKAVLVGLLIPVIREVIFKPKQNGENEMKDKMIKALEKLGVTVNADLSEDAILLAYEEAMKESLSPNTSEESTAEIVAFAMAPVLEEIKMLKESAQTKSLSDLQGLADIVGNSDLYPSLNADEAKKLGIETLSGMVANCTPAFGLPIGAPTETNAFESFDMPK